MSELNENLQEAQSLKEAIKKALLNNEDFLTQIKLSLMAVSEMLEANESLESEYKLSLEQVQKIVAEFESKKTSLNATLKNYLENFDDIALRIEEINTSCEGFFEKSQESLEESKALKDEIKELVEEVNEKALESKSALEYLKSLVDEKMPLLESSINHLVSKKEEITSFLSQKTTELSSFALELDTNVKNTKAELEKSLEKTLNALDEKAEDLGLNVDNIKAELKARIDEVLKSLEEQSEEASKKLEQKLSLAVEEINALVASFDNKYTKIHFIQEKEPQSKFKRLNDVWLDTSKGLLKSFVKNPHFSHFGTTFPLSLALRGDTWLNELGELFILKEDKKDILSFIKLDLEPLNARFKQDAKPSLESANIGDLWFKMKPLEVYYLENTSWVKIDEKLVRFKQSTEPSTDLVLELNDIWQKENEFFIYTNVYEKARALKKWVPLNESYKHTKFKGLDFPELARDENDDIANKALMRDLYFKCDESELYVCLKENDTKLFKRIDLAKEEAKYKGKDEPQILSENTIVFKNESDDENDEGFFKGEVYVYKPKSYEKKWLELEYLIKNAHFTEEKSFEIPKRYARAYDIWYKKQKHELSLYLPKDENESSSPFSWTKINLTNANTKANDKSSKNPYTSENQNLDKGDLSGFSLGDVWLYGNYLEKNEVKIFSMKGKDYAWQKVQNEELLQRELKPFIFYNDFEASYAKDKKDFSYELERLRLELRAKIDENTKIIAQNKTLAQENLSSLDTKLSANIANQANTLNTKISEAKNALTSTITNTKNALQTNINNVNKRYNYAFHHCSAKLNPVIDFNLATNFVLNLSGSSFLSCINQAHNIGKSGVIVVNQANLINSFRAPLNFRINASNLGTTEVFAYVIINANFIRLTRT